MPRSTYRVPFDVPARFVVTSDGDATDTKPNHRQRFALVTATRDGVPEYIVRDFGVGKEFPFASRHRAMQAIDRMRRNPRGYLGWPLGARTFYVEISVETVPGPRELDGRWELSTDGNGLSVVRDHENGFEIPLSDAAHAGEVFQKARAGKLDPRIYKTRPIGLA